jgi:hypothetical protein
MGRDLRESRLALSVHGAHDARRLSPLDREDTGTGRSFEPAIRSSPDGEGLGDAGASNHGTPPLAVYRAGALSLRQGLRPLVETPIASTVTILQAVSADYST